MLYENPSCSCRNRDTTVVISAQRAAPEYYRASSCLTKRSTCLRYHDNPPRVSGILREFMWLCKKATSFSNPQSATIFASLLQDSDTASRCNSVLLGVKGAVLKHSSLWITKVITLRRINTSHQHFQLQSGRQQNHET